MSNELQGWSGNPYQVNKGALDSCVDSESLAYDSELAPLFYKQVYDYRSESIRVPSSSLWLQERLEGSVQQLKELIDVDSDLRGGIPVIKGTRFTLAQLIAEIADSDLLKDLTDDLNLSFEKVTEILHCISISLDRPMQR